MRKYRKIQELHEQLPAQELMEREFALFRLPDNKRQGPYQRQRSGPAGYPGFRQRSSACADQSSPTHGKGRFRFADSRAASSHTAQQEGPGRTT